MLRTIPIWALLICSVVIVSDAKPIFIKVFAPIGGTSSAISSGTVRSTATSSPINSQLISNLISQKFQLLNSLLQVKSSFGIRKEISFLGSTTTTTTSTTDRPVTQHTTEVNTDFIPEVSSSTQSVYTTTTDGDIATPKPTVHPLKPITTSTPVIPTKSTTESTLDSTTTRTTSGYTYQPPITTTQGYTYQPPITTTQGYTYQPPLPTATPTTNGYTYRTPTPATSYLPASQS
ncbi:merozoite surface antigen 2 isoform X2 [Drosophila grimshawi]|uniref:merozoite surface antigen 2 isoform X2 n=1 Tax=Drosophila grimshawi TaxID=7222 RepID=UPI001C93694B|nr:merozoite surface antigen 2 isoform X2 [Drosophila grimshawi]